MIEQDNLSIGSVVLSTVKQKEKSVYQQMYSTDGILSVNKGCSLSSRDQRKGLVLFSYCWEGEGG